MKKQAQDSRVLKLWLELEEIFCTCVNEDYKVISKSKIVFKAKRQAVITLGNLCLPSSMFRKGQKKDINFLLISDSFLTYIARTPKWRISSWFNTEQDLFHGINIKKLFCNSDKNGLKFRFYFTSRRSNLSITMNLD